MKILLAFALFTFAIHSDAKQPALLLAKIYNPDIQLQEYWVSEKLDGVRAYWDGTHLISRQGHIFKAPKWFTQPLPNTPLDGELWLARNTFSELSGRVRRQSYINDNWRNIKYMIFDLPNSKKPFDLRIIQMKSLIHEINISHLKIIDQYKVESHQALMNNLDDIVNNGGEGLMLHRGSSLYKSGRSDNLLKLKKHFDAEAIVLKHIQGKGKFKHMMGAILVETEGKIRFKIGSGFSIQQRQNPPPVGSFVTYKYFGLTNKGKPRFASFIRIRESL